MRGKKRRYKHSKKNSISLILETHKIIIITILAVVLIISGGFAYCEIYINNEDSNTETEHLNIDCLDEDCPLAVGGETMVDQADTINLEEQPAKQQEQPVQQQEEPVQENEKKAQVSNKSKSYTKPKRRYYNKSSNNSNKNTTKEEPQVGNNDKNTNIEPKEPEKKNQPETKENDNSNEEKKDDIKENE